MNGCASGGHRNQQSSITNESTIKDHQSTIWERFFGPAQNLTSLLIFTMNARFARSGNRCDSVSRCSLSTRNSSLPGRYSHRNRTFADTASIPVLYCTSALTNIAGVTVYVTRDPARCVVDEPSMSSTQLP